MARNYFYFVAMAQIARFCIQRVNKQDCFWEGAVQFWHMASYIAGVLVLQDAFGRELQVVFFIWCFCCWFEWQREDYCFAIWFIVEFVAFACFYVWVVIFAVMLLRFFIVYYWLAQIARFVVVIEWCQIVIVIAIKLCVFFEQLFLQIEAQLAGFIVQLIFCQFGYWEFAYFGGGIQNFVQRFAMQFWFFCQQLFWLYFFSFEAAGELD